MTAQIGVFGSAFDPIHNGHINCLRQIDGRYDRIYVVPSFAHAFSKEMADFDLRLEMVDRVISSLRLTFTSHVSVTDIERLLAIDKGDEPVYTYDVLSTLSTLHQTDDIYFIVGPDNAAPDQWSRFHLSDKILARWHLDVVSQELMIRSTDIRQSVRSGYSIDSLSDRVPEIALSIIKNHNLYTGDTHA